MWRVLWRYWMFRIIGMIFIWIILTGARKDLLESHLKIRCFFTLRIMFVRLKNLRWEEQLLGLKYRIRLWLLAYLTGLLRCMILKNVVSFVLWASIRIEWALWCLCKVYWSVGLRTNLFWFMTFGKRKVWLRSTLAIREKSVLLKPKMKVKRYLLRVGQMGQLLFGTLSLDLLTSLRGTREQ